MTPLESLKNMTMTMEVLLHGRLREVNCDQGTAELHNYGAPAIALRFEAGLNKTMRQIGNPLCQSQGQRTLQRQRRTGNGYGTRGCRRAVGD